MKQFSDAAVTSVFKAYPPGLMFLRELIFDLALTYRRRKAACQ